MNRALCPYCQESEIRLIRHDGIFTSKKDGWDLGAVCLECDENFIIRVENVHIYGENRVEMVTMLPLVS